MPYRKRRRPRPVRAYRFARPELPDAEIRTDPPSRSDGLRCEITIRRHDLGRTQVRRYELFASDRCDCYRVVCNGVLVSERMGLSRVLEHARLAMPRVLSERALG
jgi:hypothetical protein